MRPGPVPADAAASRHPSRHCRLRSRAETCGRDTPFTGVSRPQVWRSDSVWGAGCVIPAEAGPGEGTRLMTFEEFAAARLPALVRYAAVLTGDREQARDIVQTVLARAFVKWARIRRTERPEAYVHRMVTNEFLNGHRRRGPLLVGLGALSGRETPTVPDHADRL